MILLMVCSLGVYDEGGTLSLDIATSSDELSIMMNYLSSTNISTSVNSHDDNHSDSHDDSTNGGDHITIDNDDVDDDDDDDDVIVVIPDILQAPTIKSND